MNARTLRSVPLVACAALSLQCASTARAPRPTARVTAPRVAASDRAAVVHLLERFTFGPRPGDVEHVERVGAEAWFESQLDPDHVADPHVASALAPYADALRRPDELYAEYAIRDDDRAIAAAPGGVDPSLPASASVALNGSTPPGEDNPAVQRERDADMARAGCRTAQGAIDAMCIQRARAQDQAELRGRLQMTALVRHIVSERQVEEVMTDFWTNHFNVFFEKGPVRWLAGDLVERAIRPNALGRFDELLAAVAHHPAMLVYLDNWRSVAAREAVPGLPARGLNENYARELLELHTLGIEGGYTQHDVVDVARVLTGWSITPPDSGMFAFQFRPWTHDRGEKTVLGQVYAAGGGEDEGVALLRALAHHPSTARFIARKLCQRFVADEPPERLVAAVARTFLDTGGDIRAMLRTIVASPEFREPADRDAKVKTPLEFVASAVRAVGARPDGTVRLAGILGRLGQPLFMDPIPTGYAERSEAWMNSGALLDRMNFALALSAGRLPGVITPEDATTPPGDPTALVRDVADRVLFGRCSARTLDAMRAAVADVPAPRTARALAVALAIGSPEFQRQ